jgi:hypothetical protein
MRKASTLIGLTLLALGAGARAEDGVPAAPPAGGAPEPFAAPAPAAVIVAPAPYAPPFEPPPRRMQVDLAFLPMGLGKYTTPIGGLPTTGDALFAYGGGASWSYRLLYGFNVGVTAQAIFNVNYKVNPSEIAGAPPARQYDGMVRLGYQFPIVDGITVYVDALPGYSIIALPGTSPAKGLVFAAEVGVAMDMTDRIFAKLGAGYEWGFQKVTQSGSDFDNKTSYLRISLGGGVRF